MIPGLIIAIITFPGIIVHEFGHKLFCQITKTKVLEVCYFRFGNPAGYVMHEPASSIWKNILISIGPFVSNTSIGFLIGLFASREVLHTSQLAYLGKGLTWLGVSIAMHSFPSTGDAGNIWRAVWSKGVPILPRVIGTPLVGVIYLGALGSVFWLDLLYGAAIAWELPKRILG